MQHTDADMLRLLECRQATPGTQLKSELASGALPSHTQNGCTWGQPASHLGGDDSVSVSQRSTPVRRSGVSLFLAVLLFIVGMVPAAGAQDATPESGLADLGLPALDVTVTASGYEGIPESLEAGRYLVTITVNEDASEFGGGVAFVQPSGMSAEEFLGLLSGPPDETGVGVASPIANGEATPAEGGEGMGGPPPAVFESLYAGGTATGPGQSAEIVVDLPPGEWIAWADEPEAPQEPVIFEVTGEMPADLAEPESAATLSMAEYVIKVTEGELVAGSQVLKIENVGAQPHFVFGAPGPDDLTAEQIGVALDEEMAAGDTGTPPAYSDFNPDEDLSFEKGFFSGTQSTGTTVWLPVTFEAGMYGMVCFFPDLGDGLPHAFKGMYAVVEVGG